MTLINRHRKSFGNVTRWSHCFCFSLILLAGCNTGDGKIPVTGVVKLSDAPLAGATVGFIGNNGGQVAHALTDATGRFTLRATPGVNKVIVNKSPDPSQLAGDGTTTSSGDESTDMLAGVEVGAAQPATQKNRWLVDQKFASPLTSGFEFDVKDGMAEIELVVTAP